MILHHLFTNDQIYCIYSSIFLIWGFRQNNFNKAKNKKIFIFLFAIISCNYCYIIEMFLLIHSHLVFSFQCAVVLVRKEQPETLQQLPTARLHHSSLHLLDALLLKARKRSTDTRSRTYTHTALGSIFL